jgi:enediyne biosynthesis protein E7
MPTDQMRDSRRPPASSEPFDVDVDGASFHFLWREFQRHGDLFRVEPVKGTRAVHVASHPDHVQRLLVANRANYVKGRGFERVRMLLGNGLIVSDGEHWLKQRKLCQPAFHKSKVAALSEGVRRHNRARLDRWERCADTGERLDITLEASELALEIILQAIFGDDYDALVEREGGNPFRLFIEHHQRDLSLVLKFRALLHLIDELVEARRARPTDTPDFLASYLAARDRETGAPMAHKDLVEELMTLIVAGHETTAATVNWMWYLVATHPEAEAELQAEVDAAAADEPPRFDQLERYPFTRRVFFETLRLYPPVWLFTRRALEADRLGDYDIPAGADVVLSPWIVHRHPDFWEAPFEFRPRRFGDSGTNARHEFAYFPFSMGPRRCTGDFLAQVEALVHFGWIAPRFRLRYEAPEPPELEPAVNLRSKHGIRMRVERR